MMKYGIKIKDRLGNDFLFKANAPRAEINEYTTKTSSKTLEFNSMGDAEVYAQNHELKNYEVVPL